MDESTRIARLLEEFNVRAHKVGLLAGKRFANPTDKDAIKKHVAAIQERQEVWNAILAEVRGLVDDRNKLRIAIQNHASVRAVPPENSKNGALSPVGEGG